MNRRLTQRGRERRRQLVDYAARRFAENGYHPTSVADIVNGMGVGKGVFYWYFSSKEELFAEILKEAQRDLRRYQQRGFGDETDPVVRIELGIRATMAWLSENRHFFLLFQFATTEDRFSEVLKHGEDIAIADASRHVTQAMAGGEIPDADPIALTHAILGVTNHLARALLYKRGDPADQVADVAVTFCLGGLRTGEVRTPSFRTGGPGLS